MKNSKSYVVKKKDGSVVSSYNLALGKMVAMQSAADCAKYSKGDIFLSETGKEDKKIVEYFED